MPGTYIYIAIAAPFEPEENRCSLYLATPENSAMPLKVYLDPLSQPGRAVMLLLEMNKVKYEKVLLQLSRGESVRSAVVRAASQVHFRRRRYT